MPGITRTVGRYGDTLSRAATPTSRMTRATSGLASTLGRAALAAGGAAAAYLSISQVQAAVTQTQELAKATLGLQKNLGLSGRAAGEWAAAATARGVETTKLAMSFKTLSTQVEAAVGGSATAQQLFSDLGISMGELKKGQTDVSGLMLEIADGMDKAGAGTQRTADAGKLFGRSWQGLAPMIRDGSGALKEALANTEKYGAALHGGVLADQEKLRSTLIESKTAWLGVKVSLAEFVTPALDDAAKSFNHIAAILASKKLTDTEKFHRVGKIIAGWAQKALDAFVAILPEIVSQAGQAAPKIAAAFVKGFLDAPALAQLSIVGMLGGRIALANMGALAGGLIGNPLGLAIAAGALAAYAGYKSGFGHELAKVAGVTSLTSKISEELQIPLQKAMRVEDYMRKHPGLGAPEALAQMEAAAKLRAKGVEGAFGDIAKSADRNSSDAWQYWRDATGKINVRGAANLEDFRKRALGAFGDVAHGADRDGGDAFQYWRDWLDKNTSNARTETHRFAKVVGGNFGSASDAALAALARLATQTNKALASLNISGKDDGKVYVAQITGGGNQADVTRAQTGAVLVRGVGSGDKVPLHVGGELAAMVEPGEQISVLNRNATRALMELNDRVPRFASGGWLGSVNGVQLDRRIIPDAKYLAARYKLAYYDGYSTSPVHAAGGEHPLGLALDIGPGPGGSWGLVTQLANRAEPTQNNPVPPWRWVGYNGDANHGVGNHLHLSWDHTGGMPPPVPSVETMKGTSAGIAKLAKIAIDGPPGPLRNAAQAVVDRVRSAASAMIARNTRRAGMEFGGVPEARGSVLRQMGTGLLAGGLNKIGAAAIIGNAYQESTWNPSSVEGLWGFHTPPVSIANVRSFAAAQGQPWDSAALQTAFLLRHLSPTHEGYSHGFVNSLNAGPLASSTARFMSDWEHPDPSVANLPRRLQGATMALRAGFQRGGVVGLAGGGIPEIQANLAPWAASYTIPQGWTAVQNRLGKLRKRAARLTDVVSEFTTLYGSMRGGAKSDRLETTSPAEAADLIRLNQNLLGVLEKRRKLDTVALALWQGRHDSRGEKIRKRLHADVVALQGRTGYGGTIGEVRSTLASLRAPVDVTGGRDPLQIGELQSFAAAIRYGAFNTEPFMGAFGKGGIALVGERGPELAHLPSGTRVHSPDETQAMLRPTIYADVYIGNEKVGDMVEMRLRENDRAQHEAYRAGSRYAR